MHTCTHAHWHTHTKKFHSKKIINQKRKRKQPHISGCVLFLRSIFISIPPLHYDLLYTQTMNTIRSAAHKDPQECIHNQGIVSAAQCFHLFTQRRSASKEKKSPLQSLSGLPAGYHGFPTQVSEVGGLSKSQTSLFKAYSLTSYCSVLERKTNKSWPFISTHPDL